ncbi:hypothetical protein D931_01865 [Enterococcus faecium 13.SD.W.09]|nr:hypothetical protein D931_01865 [Enterococcus faecium 13.SD.W.09]
MTDSVFISASMTRAIQAPFPFPTSQIIEKAANHLSVDSLLFN